MAAFRCFVTPLLLHNVCDIIRKLVTFIRRQHFSKKNVWPRVSIKIILFWRGREYGSGVAWLAEVVFTKNKCTSGRSEDSKLTKSWKTKPGRYNTSIKSILNRIGLSLVYFSKRLANSKFKRETPENIDQQLKRIITIRIRMTMIKVRNKILIYVDNLIFKIYCVII